MSVIVNDKVPIDLALRLLWRESTREGIISTLQGRRYYESPSKKRHAVEKVFIKRKKMRRRKSKRESSN